MDGVGKQQLLVESMPRSRCRRSNDSGPWVLFSLARRSPLPHAGDVFWIVLELLWCSIFLLLGHANNNDALRRSAPGVLRPEV